MEPKNKPGLRTHTRRLWVVLVFLFASCFIWRTVADLKPFPVKLPPHPSHLRKPQVLARDGTPLSTTWQNRWNVHHIVPLHEIPALLQHAFILAEDQRFYQHHGVDWRARAHAIWQNLRARRIIRGASTITEQAVRLIHPRPRTLWSRWVETVEAGQLEARFTKADILEFYLNQVPYARQRRGVRSAAHLYFNRDLETLNTKEMLALAVLVRSPSRLDLHRHPARIAPSLHHLANRLQQAELISPDELVHLRRHALHLSTPHLALQASHFVRHATQHHSSSRSTLPRATLRTTLIPSLQQHAQALLDRRLHDLRNQHVTAGALLAIDHTTNHVLAWVNAGDSEVDAVTTQRQPGSTLKPFLYALALESGWTASTLLDDTPLAQAIGVGLHRYHNYSRSYHGRIRLREALGNSLNIPAIRTIGFVGRANLLKHLHQLGFSSLTQSPQYYGDGLALGNGEVTLWELVHAYATLARQGKSIPITWRANPIRPVVDTQQTYPPEISSLITHILADPHARQREFGQGNLLHFPVATAVKTGTSTDYRDAWAIGFSHRHTVGVWMGNLSQHPMRGITGSTGPAFVLRAVFAELNRHSPPRPLALSPTLTAATICRISGQRATPTCSSMHEWFIPGTQPRQDCPIHQPNPLRPSPPSPHRVHLLQPTPGLQLAMDPRLPDAQEAFPFRLPKQVRPVQTHWFVNQQKVGETATAQREFLWPLTRGVHTAQAKVWVAGQDVPIPTPVVTFRVK